MIGNNEIIDGLLLSDATITRNNFNTGKNYFRLVQYNSSKELVEYVNNYLKSLGFNTHIGHFIHKNGSDVYEVTTTNYEYFGLQRNRWYHFGKKIVPEDLKMTPKTLAYWFMGDGSSHKSQYRIEISMATEGFVEKDVIFLQSLLNETFDIKFSIKRSRGYVTLRLSRYNDVLKFMNLVKPYILSCFNYKIKIPVKIDQNSEKWKADHPNAYTGLLLGRMGNNHKKEIII